MTNERDVAVGAYTHRGEISGPARFQERILYLGRVSQTVNHNVETAVAEIVANPRRHPLDAEVSLLLVPFVVTYVRRGIVQAVESGVEWVDPLELQLPAVGKSQRLFHFSALEQFMKDAKRWRPTA